MLLDVVEAEGEDFHNHFEEDFRPIRRFRFYILHDLVVL